MSLYSKSIFVFLSILFLFCNCGGNKKEKPHIVTHSIGVHFRDSIFDYVVNEVKSEDYVSLGYYAEGLRKEENNRYLLVNVSYQNISSIPQNLVDGVVCVVTDTNVYMYQSMQLHSVMGVGWHNAQPNPLTIEKTTFIYKIPKTMKGKLFYLPTPDAMICADLGNVSYGLPWNEKN